MFGGILAEKAAGSGREHFGEADRTEQIGRLEDALSQADAVVIGAGSGLSASAGFT